MSIIIGFGEHSDEVLQRAYRSYANERGAIRAHAADKRELLRQYDVPGMETAAAICFWGRSGSLLLASYLDGHDDVVMLPMLTSAGIYPFFREYDALSLWEKLIAYPVYSDMKWLESTFFKGDFAIAAADYYAAVHALFETYGVMPAAWQATRRRFFQFLHVAYAVALGRRPANPRPMMIFAPHLTDDVLAANFNEDFPGGRFIHTIRDPISAIDSWFERLMFLQIGVATGHRPDLASWSLTPAYGTMQSILDCDCAHSGMETLTRAVRFEDLHLAPAATMRRLAEWLGISYHPCLLDSTFNGAPYRVESGGVGWIGPKPANARRRSKNLNFADRLMIFAVLHENFVAWNYPSRSIMHRRWVRAGIIAVFWLIPMKMEWSNACAVVRFQALPSLRSGRFGFACGVPVFLLKSRLRMMRLIARGTRERLSGDRHLLKPV
jgi:hypothetical protein